MKRKFQIRSICRCCGSDDLKMYLNLETQPLANQYHKGDKLDTFPLEVMVCQNCYHSQLSVVVDPNILFDKYFWVSGTTKTSQNHFSMLANDVKNFIKKENPKVCDLACNDGSLLDEFRKIGFDVVGVDPAVNLREITKQKGIDVHVGYWSKDFSRTIPEKFDVITALNVFAHVDDNIDFLDACSVSLKEDGVAVIEFPYNLQTILNREFDQVYCLPPSSVILGCNKEISKCERGNFVFNQSGEMSVVKNSMSRNYDGEMISIKPKYLDYISCTPEHPLLVINKDSVESKSGQFKRNNIVLNPTWRLSKDVRVGDYVAVPKLKSTSAISVLDLSKFNNRNSQWRRGLQSIELTPDISWMFGLYVADGCTSVDKRGTATISIALNNNEVETKGKKLISVVEKMGYRVRKYDREKYGSKCTSFMFTCTALARAFCEWFGNNAKTKTIPDFIMLSSSEIKRNFLIGLFAGDGYYDTQINQINFHSSSKVLILQTQLLIASFGVMVGISRCPERIGKINGSTVRTSESWLLRGRSKKLSEMFEFEYISGKRLCERNYIDTDEYIYVPIISIESTHFNGMVYNIETDDHSYIVSNAVVHNCEHLSYFTMNSFKSLVDQSKLKIVSVSQHPIHGGSLRVMLKKNGDESVDVSSLIEVERNLGIFDLSTYHKFQSDVYENMKDFKLFVEDRKRCGEKVVGYGAAAKGNTALNFVKVKLDYIVDENEIKHGFLTPGMNIPVLPPAVLRDEVGVLNIVVLAWNFYDEIRKKIILERQGMPTRIVRYVPHFCIEEV
jgi:intein/homing endonuclease